MFDVGLVLDDGAWTLAESERALDQARRLELDFRALTETYLTHRLRFLPAPHDTVRLFAGYSAGRRRCGVCGGAIVAGALEYELDMASFSAVLDRECFALWQAQARHAPYAWNATPHRPPFTPR